jgi:parallel beta-helix repeat protein
MTERRNGGDRRRVFRGGRRASDRILIAALSAVGLSVLAVDAAPKPCKPPVISLTAPSSGTVGQAVPFTASVQQATGNCQVASWYLSFGDGELLSGQSAATLTTSHVYTLASEWTAELGAQAVTGPPAAPKQVRILVSAEPPPPPPPSGRGPQASIVCPAGAVNVAPGSSIQSAVNANVGATTFCLRAGVHPILGSIMPKSGNTFVGEYGAILDGSAWITNDTPFDGATRDLGFFVGINNGVTDVTIRNLVMRDGPEYAVNSYVTAANWTVEHNEIHGFRTGVAVGTAGIIRHNWIHHNIGVSSSDPSLRGGGILLGGSEGTQIVDNEISHNGPEQKFGHSGPGLNRRVYVAQNFYHHNVGNGIWNDGDGAGTIIENNTVEDNGTGPNGGAGIDIEFSNGVTVRNNTVRRQTGGEGIYVTISRNTTVTGNLLEGNAFGIGLYLDFMSLPPNSPDAPWHQDLTNNTISGNTVRVSAGQYLGMFTISSNDGGVGDRTPYASNAKQNNWSNNTYYAPNTTGNWFMWPWPNTNRSWSQWLAIPQDAGSTLTVQ